MPTEAQEFSQFLSYYTALSYEEQGHVIRKLVTEKKKPSYSICFQLNATGLLLMGKVVSYCKQYSIPYTPERKGSTKVALSFQNLSDRNEVLIGRLTTSIE